MIERQRDAKPLMSVRETAALLGKSPSTVYAWAHAGCLPGIVKISGCRLLVRRAVVEAWLRGEAPEPPSEPEARQTRRAG